MKTTAVLAGLALALGMALPVAAQPPEMADTIQVQMGPGQGGPGTGGPRMGAPGMQGRGGWQKHARHGHMRRGGRSVIFSALRNQKELGLSPQQVSSLQQLGMDARRASIKRKADGQLAKVDLFGLMRAEPVDMGKVEAKVREIEKLKADGAIARIRTNEAAKAQLSPDQREKLKTLRASQWQRRGGGRSGGEGGVDGGSEKPAAFELRS